MNLLIYFDEGVSPRSVRFLTRALQLEGVDKKLKIKRVDRHFLASENWEPTTCLLIMPGGRDIPYHQALKGSTNQKIRRYVENGGKYLGICAGGYFGCTNIEFEKGSPLEVVGSRELKFFPGTARGSAFGPNRFKYEDESGACAAEVLWEGDNQLDSASVYFNGGCEFVNAAAYPETKVLARYQNLPHHPAAIIECQVGAGKAILSGVHPEYCAFHIKHETTIPPEVIARLKEKESSRKRLFLYLLSRVL